MMTNPPRNVRNPEKLLKADGVGNGYGLVKEHLKDKFGQHDDWNDETWFTLSKGALVKKLERDSVRGTSGVDEVPGKIGIVRVNPDADIEQDKVFRAEDIDDAELIQNAKALDEGCRKWMAKALGRKKVGKLTAKVLGLGANASKVPNDKWPRPEGGLFGSIFRRNN